MTDLTYNGWTNYETWVVNLWLTNDSDSVEVLNHMAQDCLAHLPERADAVWELAKRLEEDHDELKPELNGPFADLLNHALGCVNWREIAAYIIEENLLEA